MSDGGSTGGKRGNGRSIFLSVVGAVLTHAAVAEALNGKTVDWMEKVSDEQYQR